MPVIIPLWFYEFGSVMYFFGSMICLLLTFFSFRLFDYTRKRPHLLLMLSFAFMAAGFIVLTLSNAYSFFHFEQCESGCTITRQDIFNMIILGNYIYYATSLIGYSLFLLSYMAPEEKKRRRLKLAVLPVLGATLIFQGLPSIFQPQPTLLLFPFETMFFQPFHLLSSAILILVVLKTFWNYRRMKSDMSLLIPCGFAAILIYHLMMFSLPFSAIFFAIAHLSLLAGFSILLAMLIKVTRK
jgi:hypothetical protein